MEINGSRFADHINTLAEIGKIGETGVCRLAHSKEDRQAVDVVKGWMEEAGLETRIDCFGNLIGRLEGKDQDKPILMLGSHIDSQPYGGRFDGTAGALGGIEVVHTLKDQGIDPNRTIEVVCFSDEEGSRFNKGVFGVRGLIGQLEEGELKRKDKNGVTRLEALREFGVEPDVSQSPVYQPGDIEAFLELHIEQGPVLEADNKPVGIVSAISGPIWLTVTLEGFAGHAGSVPMNLRQDAFLGAATITKEFNELVRNEGTPNTVGTVGSIQNFPNSRNIISEKVEFTIDLRDIDIEARTNLEKKLYQIIEKTASELNLEYSVSEDTKSEPRYCADWIKDIMKQEDEKLGFQSPVLMSGPFHDALFMSYISDYGMIFVRCEKGISHNPLEYAEMDDLQKGVELLYHTAAKIAQS
ncbi:Zn-dependent hydrolase [Halobacillus halophilus]|uniref:Allantoate amidohydrolase n=1 Tax=Halobacillus halophilus (strain ATCC 35676 / DSM 2266 / JCM 20832 / KCTC 3685 / LMG 17431 / NBRC 102448 / NCIMB 2269) TaxID=866895 RepID=I0JRB1_HALH3|nr:M20 family metallo-hydrolase [Halobacillus halophilus]ASF40665.1 Zn-dependent hydrolase [Halobacillus halophilus]CCG46681.1 allantoate amidohydrolase [Halobacillus halophilus DSM 2266]